MSLYFDCAISSGGGAGTESYLYVKMFSVLRSGGGDRILLMLMLLYVYCVYSTLRLKELCN